MALTYAQILLKAKLTVCSEEECETILKVYNVIKQKHEENPGLNYWCHPDFKGPLNTFVEWYNKQQPKEYKVKKIEAHEVLDEIHDSD